MVLFYLFIFLFYFLFFCGKKSPVGGLAQQVKQERARAEEALHKQARRRNQTYSKYSGDGRGAGRRPAMDIDYLEVILVWCLQGLGGGSVGP